MNNEYKYIHEREMLWLSYHSPEGLLVTNKEAYQGYQGYQGLLSAGLLGLSIIIIFHIV